MGNFNRDDKRGGGGFNRGPRQMFSATCSKCGQSCEVPFRPTGERPVFCSNCFKSQGGPSQRFAPKSFPASSRLIGGQAAGRGGIAPQAPCGGVSKAQIDSLNAKLDKILTILAPAKLENAPKMDVLLETKDHRLSGAGKKVKKEKVPVKKSKARKK